MSDTLWIRIKRRTLDAAIAALKLLSAKCHDEARSEHNETRAEVLRAEADYNDAEAENLRSAIYQDESAGMVTHENIETQGSVQVVKLQLGDRVEKAFTWFIPTIVILIVVIAGCGLVMGLNLAEQAQMDRDFKEMKTQGWLVERRLMDREAYDILRGGKVPGDDANGPTGNLQRMKPNEKK